MTLHDRRPEHTGPTWRRSSYSNTQGNQCVEVAVIGDRIALRDSKDPNGPVLTFSKAEWRQFVRRMRHTA